MELDDSGTAPAVVLEVSARDVYGVAEPRVAAYFYSFGGALNALRDVAREQSTEAYPMTWTDPVQEPGDGCTVARGAIIGVGANGDVWTYGTYAISDYRYGGAL